MNIQVRKFYYGDIPEETGGGSATAINTANTASPWPLWEVFIRSKQGLDHKHVGSLHAADVAMAIENARDVYTHAAGRRKHLGCRKQICTCQQSR